MPLIHTSTTQQSQSSNNTPEAKLAAKAIIKSAFATLNNLDPHIDTYDADMLACLQEVEGTIIDDTFAQINTKTVLGDKPDAPYCPIATTLGTEPTKNFIMEKETIASLQAPKEIEILPIPPVNLMSYTYHHNNFHTNSEQ